VTTKHIKLAFERASHHGAALFLDEADSLLSNRVRLDEPCATLINQNRNTLMQELDRLLRAKAMPSRPAGSWKTAADVVRSVRLS